MNLPGEQPEPSTEAKQLAVEREAREREAQEWRIITNILRDAAHKAGGTAKEQLKRYNAALDFFISARQEGRADAAINALKVARSQRVTVVDPYSLRIGKLGFLLASLVVRFIAWAVISHQQTRQEQQKAHRPGAARR